MTIRICLLAALLVLTAGCDKPDPFGGCERHPGECGRAK